MTDEEGTAMTQSQISDLLSQQADRLTAGAQGALPGRGEGLPSLERAGLTGDEQRLLGELMQLARRMHAGLVEVEPRPAFAADLKARLVAQRRAARDAAPTGHGRLWVAGVVGALSLAGLGFLSYRVARAGASWISSTSSAHGARAALPKA